MPFSTADMKVNGLATKGKVLDNPFGGKAVTAYCAGLAVCFFHKVTLIQPEVYLGNVLLDIYHIKIICEYLWKDTTQQLLGLHDAKITNTYEIMCMRREGCNWVLRLTLILFNKGGYTDKKGNLNWGKGRLMLLGILYAGPQLTVSGDIKIVTIPDVQEKALSISHIPNNLGYIIKSEALLDFVPIIKSILEL